MYKYKEGDIIELVPASTFHKDFSYDCNLLIKAEIKEVDKNDEDLPYWIAYDGHRHWIKFEDIRESPIHVGGE